MMDSVNAECYYRIPYPLKVAATLVPVAASRSTLEGRNVLMPLVSLAMDSKD